MVVGGGFEPPKLARQIYNLIPLATREPHHEESAYNRDLNLVCKEKIAQKLQKKCHESFTQSS